MAPKLIHRLGGVLYGSHMRVTDPITFGSTVRSLTLPSGVLTETVHAAGMELPRHEHSSANVNFVLRGEFGEWIQG